MSEPSAKLEVAVIGAGVCGLTAARELARAGIRVRVFDKGRGVGGRASTRRDDAGRQFDHGAQYFTARDERFVAEIESWIRAGRVAEWSPRLVSLKIDAHGAGDRGSVSYGTRRYVGTPGMNAVARGLAGDVTAIAGAGAVQSGVRVVPPKPIAASGDGRSGPRWRLSSDAGETLGEFDRVLVTSPAPQAAELLSSSPALSNAARSVVVTPCWGTMVEFAGAAGIDFDGAFVEPAAGAPAPVLSWVARDDSKPQREARGAERWVLHASPTWSAANESIGADGVGPLLLAALWQATGARPVPHASLASHLWRYALPQNPLANRSLADPERGLFAAGDWCGGPRIEGAYLSGLAAAEAILAHG
ncbi:MAG: NAD(P)/FAD-dependent oxidoreductase [Lacipirellulaceae bacterium]